MRTLKKLLVFCHGGSGCNGLSGNDGWLRQDVSTKIHGAILAVRDNPSHVQDMKDHGDAPIDLM